jgi:hypothetical protein
MTFSGRQKHSLENQVRAILTGLLAEFGIEIERDREGDFRPEVAQNIKISKETTDRTNNIVKLFLDNPENHGSVGILRGYIRQQRNKISSIVKDINTEQDGRMPNIGYFTEYGVYQNILSATKLQMNGENILKVPICKYEDQEEQDQYGTAYYCMEQVDYGYDYCFDHWQIVREQEPSGLQEV